MTQQNQPLIGLTGSLGCNSSGSPVYQVGQAYLAAIQKAGGIPLLIPTGLGQAALRAIVQKLDGLLLTGGGDIDPQRFQGKPHPKVYDVSPERDELELSLIKETLSTAKPLLAICRGVQILNVAFGGTLYTHLADQAKNPLKHDWFPGYPRDKIAHTVSLKCGSLLHGIFTADEVPVNSLHHQGIARVGNGLEAIGFAPDGLVEALIVKDARFALGVQWHPECLPDDPKMEALFLAFVDAC